MKVHCSTEKPWGNHLPLRDGQCPRCGWAADVPADVGQAPDVQPTERFPWALIVGGLPQAAAA